MTDRTADEILKRTSEAAAKLDIPEPSFEFELGWSDCYEALSAGRYQGAWSIPDLLQETLNHGRVLLHADGGAGKSTIARRLLQCAANQQIAAFLISLRLWTEEITEVWQARLEDASRIEILFGLMEPKVSEAVIASLAGSTKGVLVVDGLNEVPADIAPELLSVVDMIARRHPHVGVLVTDRLNRHVLSADRWILATITSVAPPGPTKMESRLPRRLELALFLDMARKVDRDSRSSSVFLHAFFTDDLGLGDDELKAAANAALDAYRSTRARRFPIDQFRQSAGGAATDKLRRGSALLVSDGEAYFAHHLYHDFLAGLALAYSNPSLWTHSIFDAVSFRASSFEPIGLALEQIGGTSRADEFLLRVYDWNFYGSAFALARGRAEEDCAVSEHLELALVALLAERRWDVIEETRQEIADALRAFQGGPAGALREAQGIQGIIEIVGQASHADSRFQSWQSAFTAKPGHPASDDLLSMLSDDDPLLGWTASNVLRRAEVGVGGQRGIRQLLRRHRKSVIRWRAAHTLGMHGGRANVKALLAALEDADHWVRAGAIRALIEIAGTSCAERDAVLNEVVRRADEIAVDPTMAEWLRSSLLLASPPSDWEEAAAPVVEELWARAPSKEEQERWREQGFRIRKHARDLQHTDRSRRGAP